LQYRFLF